MTVPQLRAECKRRGLPCYQHKGRRLRKADLLAALRRVGFTPPSPPPAAQRARQRTPRPSGNLQVESAPRAVNADYLDWVVACKHAAALGVTRDDLLERDRLTMHRILRGVARPCDERHWRTKAVIRGIVAGA